MTVRLRAGAAFYVGRDRVVQVGEVFDVPLDLANELLAIGRVEVVTLNGAGVTLQSKSRVEWFPAGKSPGWIKGADQRPPR